MTVEIEHPVHVGGPEKERKKDGEKLGSFSHAEREKLEPNFLPTHHF